MLRPRIIPCLLVHDGGLVKTVKFGDPKYVGDPINAVKIFNEKEADELTVLDIDATVQGRDPNYRLISQFAAECRMPLCYGGGITKVEQAKRIIGLGVEKIAISAAAVASPQLITAIAQEIGSQSVVVVLDARRKMPGGWEVCTHNGRRATGRPPVELARGIRESVRLPLTVLGGAGSLADIAKLIETCGVVGAAAGSLFVFKGVYRAVLI